MRRRVRTDPGSEGARARSNFVHWLLAAAVLLTGCSRISRSDSDGNTSATAVEILVPETEPYAADEDGSRREIRIASTSPDAVIGGDRIMLRAPAATLLITYPLHHPASFPIGPDSPPNGYSLRGLVRAIAEHYADVYKVEAATATKPAGNAGALENRGTTDGKYGIWGHHLEDLFLEHITIRRDVIADRVIVELHVGS